MVVFEVFIVLFVGFVVAVIFVVFVAVVLTEIVVEEFFAVAIAKIAAIELD